MVRILDSILSLFFNKKFFYGFFYHLYLLGLKGIEHGRNYGLISTSGELRVIELVGRHFKSPIIFDVGSNVGEYSLKCNNLEGCRIYAFEPSAPTFKMLKNNTQDHLKISVFQMALSDECKKLVLRYDVEGSAIASIVDCNFDHYGLKLNMTELVDGITIDNFCETNNIDRINLLKLDVEGYELNVLKGGKKMFELGNIDIVQFEMGRPNVDSRVFFKDFYIFFKEDFNIYRILSFGFVLIEEYSYEYEIFMGCNYLAVKKDLKIKI